MSNNVNSAESSSRSPRLVILSGAMVEQPEQFNSWTQDWLSATMNVFGPSMLTHSPTLYDALLTANPGAELVVLKGYGILSTPEAVYEDAKEKVAATKGNPVHIIGHSLGGLIGHRMAVEQPAAVSGCVSIDGASERLLDVFPFNLPPYSVAASSLISPHIKVIREGYDPKRRQKIGAIASTESTVSPKSALYLDLTALNLRRILFGRQEFSGDEDPNAIERRVTNGDLSHIGLVSNEHVIRACGQILGRVATNNQRIANVAA